MKRMWAVITVELVDESSAENANTIQRDLLKWFKEDCLFIPWVKQVKGIVVKEE
ncbi:MAG: hypothetical protein NZ932_03300 [Candidatus Bathyarchaeota archaeon]|nr:hypothetical protein [Candidatus Bathyarchaeota archaeon]MDW8022579.1 hypothetical protein [Nitrososphaerota archaeon]MDW8041035.1 hypothetical protein [Nitrososphaerota archaeon]